MYLSEEFHQTMRAAKELANLMNKPRANRATVLGLL